MTRYADGNNVAAWIKAASGSAPSDESQSLLRPTRQQVRLCGGDVSIHHFLWFAQHGQLSASFLEQGQAC